jgi:1,4-alpha-glucan branching enzyme
MNEPMPVFSRLRTQPAKEASTERAIDTPCYQTVHFEFFAPEARAVFLAGSFNDWSPAATPMHRQTEVKWVTKLLLPPGRYEYQFVVDGRWTPDLKAADEMPNPFGGFNSVVEVSKSL